MVFIVYKTSHRFAPAIRTYENNQLLTCSTISNEKKEQCGQLKVLSPAANNTGNKLTHQKFSEIQEGRQQERSTYPLLVNQE
jgi:hypothetical protein